MQRKTHSNEIVSEVIRWLDEAVIGLHLCPFAKTPRQSDKIRFEVSNAQTDEDLLTDLADQCLYLADQPSIETTLLIIPVHLQLFDDFNQFLALTEELLERMNWSGVFQVASFHPNYQFANTSYNDRENWTNRAPYPILHVIRESSLSRVVETYPDIERIPLRNIDRLNQLDSTAMKRIFSGGKN
ncbi:MAG: DUF1415 domain-containing protein [Gammaproteobacteria bacterium]|nr:DUF1415 domain-containing protein [Gammaproteobacteria bacterium]